MNFFTDQELDCKCGRKVCDAAPMDIYTVAKLNGLRLEFGKPMTVNSARRCKWYNAQPHVGGKPQSMHLEGKAVDIHCPDGEFMDELFELAKKHGFTGRGVKKRMLHLDTRPGRRVMFGY